MKKIILLTIKLYQKTVSPDHGLFYQSRPYLGCRYYPSCSEYAYQAIAAKGVCLGFFSAIKRVLRCHPFSSGGYDPVDGPI